MPQCKLLIDDCTEVLAADALSAAEIRPDGGTLCLVVAVQIFVGGLPDQLWFLLILQLPLNVTLCAEAIS